jgi:hypothetical protein
VADPLPPHLQAQASAQTQASAEAVTDVAVKDWMTIMGTDPESINGHWREAYKAYAKQLEDFDSPTPRNREEPLKPGR